MKGDFSLLGFDPESQYTGVRHQQGRVLLDRDWNDAQEIEAWWRRSVAADAFGPTVLAVPAASSSAFQVLAAVADAAGVHVALDAGRAWAAGLPVSLAASATFDAEYLGPPLVPAVSPATIGAGVRDAVVLEVWEDTVSAFQDPALLERALGGPDTTERVRAFTTLRLLRLGTTEDCSAVASLVDDPAARGHLSVTPSTAIVITGDCPLEAGGGYTGLEHFLYRIEIGSPGAAGQPRFKWSRYNGGLVGRGIFVAGAVPATGTVTITANDQAINTCGISTFYLEALAFDAAAGAWQITFSAVASRSVDGVLALTTTSGVWPAPVGGTAFFRLWDGIADVGGFATGAPEPLVDGIELEFDVPAADGSNYRPGDYWAFPVRTTGAAFDPPVWPANAPAMGITYRRAALGVVAWQADKTASWELGQISDCRHIFRPLAQQKICCSYVVGDGHSSFGDFNSIELALRHLPAAGGEICLLPGLHTTNAIIANRVNVTIRGCGARTRVLPRERTLDQPIISVVDSVRVEIEHIDFVTLGGTAIWIEGTKPGACADIVVARNRILSCTHAVLARNASNLVIANNRIRMFDKEGGLAAIDVSADDTLIERNDIALVPAERTPPVDPDDPDDPLDPVDPCTRLQLVYTRPLVFTRYVNAFWAIKLPIALILKIARPYIALGGIQVRGGSERVRVLENHVVGGAGNGITLGSAAVAPPSAPPAPSLQMSEGTLMGRVVGPDGQPAAGVQITLTRQPDGAQRTFTSDKSGRFTGGFDDGTYEVSEGAVGFEMDKIDVQRPEGRNVVVLTVVLKAIGAAPEADSGFLYDIAIERNRVEAMGLNGIGAPLPLSSPRQSTLVRARALLGSPVIGLAIRDNRLLDNLRNPFDAAMRAAATTRGLGGISLGLVDDLAITGNRIQGHGRSGADPVCGVFVQYGEAVEVARNTILDNGIAPSAATAVIGDGLRGGIVLGLVASFGLFAQLRRGAGVAGAAASAARILANHVEQPVGCALYVRAFGPLMVDDNVLASERSAVGGLDALAGTVLIANLAGVQNAGLAVQASAAAPVSTAPAGDPAEAPTTQPIGLLAGTRLQTAQAAAVRIAALLPVGATLVSDNQVRAGPAHRSPVTQLLIGYDDIGFSSNQCHTDQAGNVMANTFVVAATLRAIGNRLRERAANTNLSLLTIATRANDTSLNQGDHCIVAQDTDPAPPTTVQTGNQVMLPNARCTSFNTITALLFKPLAATLQT
ncbi:MAG: DUF6519 domain-containing protein [Caldimonas sp.]